MELYSGAKMMNEKDLKTKYLRSKNREFTVYTLSHLVGSLPFTMSTMHGHMNIKHTKICRILSVASKYLFSLMFFIVGNMGTFQTTWPSTAVETRYSISYVIFIAYI
jgi:hypothetical protein